MKIIDVVSLAIPAIKVIRFARLAFVDKPNDGFGQSGAVVSLYAAGIDSRVTPARSDQLFGRGRINEGAAGFRQRRRRRLGINATVGLDGVRGGLARACRLRSARGGLTRRGLRHRDERCAQ